MLKAINGQRYLLALTALFAVASGVSVILTGVRMLRTDSITYGFLLWNLILAWLPFVLATLTFQLAKTRKRLLYLLVAGTALAWLVFFPNAPYILTDYQHLGNTSSQVPVWYDVLMLTWFAWTGLMLGIASLWLMQEVVEAVVGRTAGWLFVACVSVLSAFGVYLGRFLRWNTWDLWHRPRSLMADITSRLMNPLSTDHPIVFTALFASLFFFIYLSVWLISRLAKPGEMRFAGQAPESLHDSSPVTGNGAQSGETTASGRGSADVPVAGRL